MARLAVALEEFGAPIGLQGEKAGPGVLDGMSVEFLAKEDLIQMKRQVGRPQDLADIKALESG